MTTLVYTLHCLECGDLPFTGEVDRAAEKHCQATRHPVYTLGVPSLGQQPRQPHRDHRDGDHPHGDTDANQDPPDPAP